VKNTATYRLSTAKSHRHRPAAASSSKRECENNKSKVSEMREQQLEGEQEKSKNL